MVDRAEPIRSPRPIDYATIAAGYYQELPAMRKELLDEIQRARNDTSYEIGRLAAEVGKLASHIRPGSLRPVPLPLPGERTPTGSHLILTEEQAQMYQDAANYRWWRGSARDVAKGAFKVIGTLFLTAACGWFARGVYMFIITHR